MTKPWHGVTVATALPLTDGLSIDLDGYAAHCRRLLDEGCDGVVPNGSLGEYQTLTPQERARVVETAVAAVGGERVMPGVAAYGALEARRWAEQAREAGCGAVMLLPPTAYRADERSVVEHYREVARAGLPVVAYNNPHDTRVDLTPGLLARLYRTLHPLLRWDSETVFVQAVKLAMDLAGHRGGPCRPPRLPLSAEQEAAVREATLRALIAIKEDL
ncbi:dihydrodipicolinate synthase family protein [Streptosporangium saharense]|uniref:dihydrodipicolinate synthase family protein n=1 Tax=Streptosporangium saharense TaxID=1706840 RepID=UPI0033338CE6